MEGDEIEEILTSYRFIFIPNLCKYVHSIILEIQFLHLTLYCTGRLYTCTGPNIDPINKHQSAGEGSSSLANFTRGKDLSYV